MSASDLNYGFVGGGGHVGGHVGGHGGSSGRVVGGLHGMDTFAASSSCNDIMIGNSSSTPASSLSPAIFSSRKLLNDAVIMMCYLLLLWFRLWTFLWFFLSKEAFEFFEAFMDTNCKSIWCRFFKVIVKPNCHQVISFQPWESHRNNFSPRKVAFSIKKFKRLLSWKHLGKFWLVPSIGVVFIYKVEWLSMYIFMPRQKTPQPYPHYYLSITHDLIIFSMVVCIFLSWLLPWHKCSQATITSWNSLYPRLCNTTGSKNFRSPISKILT